MKLRKSVVFGGWTLSLGFIYINIFKNPKYYLPGLNLDIYHAVRQELYTCSLCWIIFACHVLKSGGILRKFLSLHFWQPLSKLCMGIFLLHMCYIYYTLDYREDMNRAPGFGWMLHISIGDIVVSTAVALAFHLFVEAPISNLIGMLWVKNSNDSGNSKEVLNSEELQSSLLPKVRIM